MNHQGRPRRGRHPPHARAHRARDRREEPRRQRRARRHPPPRRPSRHPAAPARLRPAGDRGPARRDRHRLLPRRPRHPRGARWSTPRTCRSGSRTTRSSSSTTSSTPAARCAPGSRRCSTTAAPPASSSPCSPTAATASSDPPRLRRQEPPDRPLRARQRPRRRARRRDEVTITQPPGGPRMRHLLSIEDLDRPDIERILDRAKSFTEVSEREVKKVPALRGRRVLNLFYEASTRTRSSFELAAKTLSAEVINFVSSGSSVEKGESLKDTVQTLCAYRPDLIVIRTPHVGAAAAGRPLDRRRGRQRRRRQARAPHAGAARRLHAARAARLARRREHLDRRRRPALPRRALEHPRLHQARRAGHRLRPADADPARDGGARLRGRLHARPASARPTSSTRCGCRRSA